MPATAGPAWPKARCATWMSLPGPTPFSMPWKKQGVEASFCPAPVLWQHQAGTGLFQSGQSGGGIDQAHPHGRAPHLAAQPQFQCEDLAGRQGNVGAAAPAPGREPARAPAPWFWPPTSTASAATTAIWWWPPCRPGSNPLPRPTPNRRSKPPPRPRLWRPWRQRRPPAAGLRPCSRARGPSIRE